MSGPYLYFFPCKRPCQPFILSIPLSPKQVRRNPQHSNSFFLIVAGGFLLPVVETRPCLEQPFIAAVPKRLLVQRLMVLQTRELATNPVIEHNEFQPKCKKEIKAGTNY